MRQHLKLLIEAVEEAVQHTIHDIGYIGMEEHMFGNEACAEMLWRARYWIAWCYEFPRNLFLAVSCAVCNHDWEDTSFSSPDSGDMSGYCKRCGIGYHHQLY